MHLKLFFDLIFRTPFSLARNVSFVNLTTNSHTRHAAFAIGMVTNSRIYTTHCTTSHAPSRTRHAAFAIKIASDGVDEEAFNEIKEKEEEEEADGVVQLLSVGFVFLILIITAVIIIVIVQ